MNLFIRLITAVIRDLVYAWDTVRAAPGRVRKWWHVRQACRRSWNEAAQPLPDYDEYARALQRRPDLDISEIEDPFSEPF